MPQPQYIPDSCWDQGTLQLEKKKDLISQEVPAATTDSLPANPPGDLPPPDYSLSLS